MKCEMCKKEVSNFDAIQDFDAHEFTTVHVFCSKECEKKYKAGRKKADLVDSHI